MEFPEKNSFFCCLFPPPADPPSKLKVVANVHSRTNTHTLFCGRLIFTRCWFGGSEKERLRSSYEVDNPSPILDENRASMGPESISSPGGLGSGERLLRLAHQITIANC